MSISIKLYAYGTIINQKIRACGATRPKTRCMARLVTEAKCLNYVNY
jgi:hypothetical protein